MKVIDDVEYKKILTDMLIYIDDICRKNKIKYSLVGGSLIGAIRHKGFIPWDDDIDIILNQENHDKLIKILKESTHKYYQIVDNSIEKSYCYPFEKLIDTRTTMVENTGYVINNYGGYIDIFTYSNVYNNKFLQKLYYKILIFIKRLLFYCFKTTKNKSVFKQTVNKITLLFGKIVGVRRIIKLYNFHFNRCKDKQTNYIVSNWPAYGYAHEIQKNIDTNDVIDVDFEGHKVMVYRQYDQILRTTFNDYMKMPKEKDRVNHKIEAYWKD